MDGFTKGASSDKCVFRWAKPCPHLRRKTLRTTRFGEAFATLLGGRNQAHKTRRGSPVMPSLANGPWSGDERLSRA